MAHLRADQRGPAARRRGRRRLLRAAGAVPGRHRLRLVLWAVRQGRRHRPAPRHARRPAAGRRLRHRAGADRRASYRRATPSSGSASLFGLGLALWSANAGMKAIIDALNVVYDENEKRRFIKLNLISLAFTLGAIASLLAAIGAVVVLPLVLSWVGLGDVTELLIRVLRWPALLAVVLFGLAVLYRYGPSRTNGAMAMAERRQPPRRRPVARRVRVVVVVSGKLRRLRRDLRLARRRDRHDDVDVDVDHRHPGSAPSSTPRSSTRPPATRRSGRRNRSAPAGPRWPIPSAPRRRDRLTAPLLVPLRHNSSTGRSRPGRIVLWSKARPTPTKQYATSGGNTGRLASATSSGEMRMLTVQLIGAAFLLLCIAPLLSRDPGARRLTR